MAVVRTLADEIRDQAKDALQRGDAALQKGEIGLAQNWFERARRLVPADPAVLLALGGALLRRGDAAAAAVFAEAAAKADTSEIWQGLAAASLLAGRQAAARDALAMLLTGHVLPADTTTIARLAAMAGVDGWCGITRMEGGLAVATDRADAEIRLDGEIVPDRILPSLGILLHAAAGGTTLLGTPIDLRRLREVEGFATEHEGGLTGWAWLPRDAETDPWLTIRDDAGMVRVVQATGGDVTPLRPMARPRGFVVSAVDLAGFGPQIHVTATDGSALTGSPVDPGAALRAATYAARSVAQAVPAIGMALLSDPSVDLSAPAGLIGPPARATCSPDRPVAVVVPVYRDRLLTLTCLRSVFATCPAAPVIVVDDATPEPELAAELNILAARGRITLIRQPINAGFPTAANVGLRAAFSLSPDHDALLLNSDTLLPEHAGTSWLDRLRAAVHGAVDIGTAAPLSNDATVLSYPLRDGSNLVPDAAQLAEIDALAARANAGAIVDIPTSVGFCMYVRRECAVQTGLFRTALFAQGYGEENDFCIRARHLGWRHVAVPGVFVAHVGGGSFGHARSPLVTRNLAVLERLHPGYHALIADYQRAIPFEDALAPARRRLDALRWASGRRERAVVLVTHDTGGGVERVVRDRAKEIEAAGQRAIVLRPVHDPDSEGGFMPGLCRIGDGGRPFANLVYRLPEELPALADLLRHDRPTALEVHHRLGHHPSVIELASMLDLPTDHALHDYASFCPRVTLIGPDRRYCGEPVEVAVCEACIADAGSRTGEIIGIAELRTRSAAEFAAARSVVVPSPDMAARLRRHFPSLQADIRALEDDARLPAPPLFADTATLRIAVIGSIGIDKGYDVLLACARDAAQRRLPLEFRLVGHSTDDARLIDTGRVFVTGRFGEAEAAGLIRAQQAHMALLPSICPETWGFTLGLAWSAGLQAVVFDIGAMAARVRASGRGVVLPLGLPAPGVNQALLRMVRADLPHGPRNA